jgi:hypothetical protein
MKSINIAALTALTAISLASPVLATRQGLPSGRVGDHQSGPADSTVKKSVNEIIIEHPDLSGLKHDDGTFHCHPSCEPPKETESGSIR